MTLVNVQDPLLMHKEKTVTSRNIISSAYHAAVEWRFVDDHVDGRIYLSSGIDGLILQLR